MREFNTSGPNNPKEYYTLLRQELIEKGLKLVQKSRYFTIWAPRQSGKSTYFLLLSEELRKQGYKVAWVSFEGFDNEPIDVFLDALLYEINTQWKKNFSAKTITSLFTQIRKDNDNKCVLIIDEVEGINP